MIRPSRHQRPEAGHGALELHQRLSAQRRRTLRLTAGAAAACAVSLTGWLLALPSLWHLAATLLAFALGALAALSLEPLRRSGHWALEWIAARSGLSYQTALELEAEDRYGLAAAVHERAAAQALRLEPPKPSAWWLPPLVAAVLLALVPVTPFGGASRALPLVPQTSERAPSEQAGDLAPAAPEPPAADGEAEPPAAGLPDEPAPGAPATLDGVQSGGQAEDAAASGRATDATALEEFLQALEEAGPPPDSEAANPFRSVQQRQEASEPPAGGEARGEPQQGREEGETSTEQGGGEPGAAQDVGGEQASGGPSGDPGDEAGQQGEDGAPDESEAQGGGEQQPEAGDQNGAPQGASAEPAPAPGEGQAMEAGQRGDDEAGVSEGGADAGAGVGLAGEPGTGLSGPQGDPDLLQGQRGEGSSSLAGTVRLPGAPESDALPGGAAAGGFERAAEEAIQEGRIPLEYQEIVRNYFQ